MAPQLGYVLTRIEHLNARRQLGELHECGEFKELAPAISFPRYLCSQAFDYDRPGYIVEYELLEIAMVNEPIPGRKSSR